MELGVLFRLTWLLAEFSSSDCKTELPDFFLAVIWGLLSATRHHPHFLACGPLTGFHNMAAYVEGQWEILSLSSPLRQSYQTYRNHRSICTTTFATHILPTSKERHTQGQDAQGDIYVCLTHVCQT